MIRKRMKMIILSVGLLIILSACTFQKESNTKVEQGMHLHPHLEIEIEGKNVVIPSGIGLLPGKHSAIHTHKENNILHVESTEVRPFYLKEFFAIWGKTFNEQCIFEYCQDATHDLKVYVNGKQDTRFGNIVLEDTQQIKIGYTAK